MHWINTSLNNTKILEVITAKCFHKCHNNKQFIPRVCMFINHKMTHRYIYFRFTRHALQIHHVTMLNCLHGYKRLCCQNLAYRQTEIKWSFFVKHLNSWFAGAHKNHENWYTTNTNELTVVYTTSMKSTGTNNVSSFPHLLQPADTHSLGLYPTLEKPKSYMRGRLHRTFYVFHQF